MSLFGALVVVLAVVLVAAADQVSCPGIDKASPLIGSGGFAYGYGSINPGASFPRGALRLGPDTTQSAANLGFEHFSGYNYKDDHIRMFSHTHYVGAGINGLGNFGVMPRTHKHGGKGIDAFSGKSTKEYAAWRLLCEWHSTFDKASETAKPGHYSVKLDKPGVQAQVLATSGFSGMHRYKWTEDAVKRKESRGLVLDVCHSSHSEYEWPPSSDKSHCKAATLTLRADGSIDAMVENSYKMYLHVQVVQVGKDGSETPISGSIDGCRLVACGNGEDEGKVECVNAGPAGNTTITSANGVMLAELLLDHKAAAEAGFELQLHVGLSFVSADVARQNLAAALPAAQSFFAASENTQDVWCEALSHLEVSAPAQPAVETMLYSAAYRSLLTPAVYSEAGGVYMGFDGALNNVNDQRAARYGTDASTDADGRFYSDFSLWDTFRTQNPWLFFTDETMYLGVLRSWAEITQQQGSFPKWTTASDDNGCMIGLAGAAGVLEASLAGFGQLDMDMQCMQRKLQAVAEADDHDNKAPKNSRKDNLHYLKYGYVSSEAVSKGSSYTVTYAFDDHILAGISDAVGAKEDAAAARLRSQNYRTIFDADAKVICPRAANNGTISCAKEPQQDFKHYTEGNALHWTYFVPHDVPGLISMYGTDTASAATAFESRLDTFFEKHITFQKLYGAALPNPYFWAGNEPTMLTPYLFAYLGTPTACAKTQKWTRQALAMHFTDTFKGIPGNDDYAAMSTWLLWSSLGIYPNAGSNNFFLTAPAVESATVTLKQLQPATKEGVRGEQSTAALRIEAHNFSTENVYVEKLLINGQEHTSPFVDRAILVAGAHLEFFLSAEPTTSLCMS